MTATSTARVGTDRPGRYAKQLVAHLSRHTTGEWSEQAGTGTITFDFGSATLAAEPDALALSVTGEPDALERLESVVGRHLVRFGAKDELVVQWQRSTGEPGTAQRNDGD